MFLSFLAIAAAFGTASVAAAPLDPSDPSTFYQPGEERRSFDLVMRPYPIPVAVTTYVNFVFNLPPDLPDLFHVVMGEVVNSQPQHLHHFVVKGCAKRIDPAEEGLPAGSPGDACVLPLGGWAPGSDVFDNVALDTGMLMGRALGVEAVRLNVHYTDGAYADAAAQTPKLATDGIRVHYTPTFRPYTSVMKPLINVGSAPPALAVPPGEERFYLTRSCRVTSGCRDQPDQLAALAALATPDQLRAVAKRLGTETGALAAGDITCDAARPLCGIRRVAQALCPTTCGLCDGADNPRVPAAYRVMAVWYHAHLLGREMYTTLLHDEEGEEGGDVAATARVGAPTGTTPTTTTTDLESREIWLYNFQETIPLGVAADGDGEGGAPQRQGIEVRPGDRIQVTCVYDSSRRDAPTHFGMSTYDEMCITSALVTFATPASLTDGDQGGDGAGIDPFAELRLLSFSCDGGEAGDVHAGSLAAGEDARDIWRDHPVEKATGCTFPVSEFLLGLRATRNCPSEDGGARVEALATSTAAEEEGASDDVSASTAEEADAKDGDSESTVEGKGTKEGDLDTQAEAEEIEGDRLDTATGEGKTIDGAEVENAAAAVPGSRVLALLTAFWWLCNLALVWLG